MDVQTIQARFDNQEQAESAIRKLAALRGDRFRIEREGSFSVEFAAELGTPEEAAESGSFTLSANIPQEASDRARSVIEAAGGRMA
ncbi:hypothetical protein [Cohnella candidum]|uniref:Uncharacterized protein n=1 Tax=Cohnella candidum TaxID=2674991 RepID=A0A3G3JU23_9BACL|nr:hypothetical protein [Cohnella candidum]AYQ71728.1 hypothetical protein EAV92_03550 [Cohnella candidum]